tara:strand:- start:458 stop:1102 length:645 start_codon:yes stop_codon:yes gene_type:complete
MVNYSNGIIYKICCNDSTITDCYIGSTCSFKSRKCAHKSVCNNINGEKYNYNVYQFIRANRGWSNWSMIQLEAYEAVDKRNLETRERYWIDLLKPSLNKIIPTRTKKEYRIENKETIAEVKKLYYTNNKETLIKKAKIYNNENKETISEYQKIYYTNNKEKHKLYRIENKDKINEYRKLYYINNKDKNRDKINEKQMINYHLRFYKKLEAFILS